MDDITAAATRLLALMGHGGHLWDDRGDTPPLGIDDYDRQALADAQLEQRRRAREAWV